MSYHPYARLIKQNIPAEIPAEIVCIITSYLRSDYISASYVAAAADEFFPSAIAQLIGLYARDTEQDIVELISWDCESLQSPIPTCNGAHTIICKIVPSDRRILYYDEFGNERRREWSHIIVSFVLSSNELWSIDDWHMPLGELYDDILKNKTRDYQSSYFLPFINMFHACLCAAALNGD